MHLIYGSRTYGHVDEIDGLGHVATDFAHIFWIPIIPKESLLVTKKRWNGVEGIPISLSLKSVCVGYLRAFCILCVIASFGAANSLFGPEAKDLEPRQFENFKTIMILGAFAIPTYIATMLPGFTQASYETAISLIQKTGLDQSAKIVVDMEYGKISEAEARRLLAPAANRYDYQASSSEYSEHPMGVG